MEIDALQKNHNEDLVLLEDARKHEAELIASLEAIKIAHQAEIDQLRVEHEEANDRILQEERARLDKIVADLEMMQSEERERGRTDKESHHREEALQKKHNEDLALLEDARKHEAELIASLEAIKIAHQAEIDQLRVEHEEANDRILQEEKARLDKIIADLEMKQSEERERGRTDQESHHREVVEDLNTQLTQARRQLDEFTALSRDQVMSLFAYISHMFTLPFRR